jgi:hypothetical protein
MNKKNKLDNINPMFQAGLEFQSFFQEKNWPFCYIGGLAVLRWGEIRMTQDIDLCLLCGFGNEEKYIKTLIENYTSRISDAHHFALENRVLLLYASNNVPVDISLSGLHFEEKMIERSTSYTFHPDCELITCSAEDLIIIKTFADRDKDWIDIKGIIAKQKNKLDTDYIITQLTPLCEIKESSEILKKLQNVLKGN